MDAITDEEENVLADAYNIYGNDWAKLLNHIRAQQGPFSPVYHNPNRSNDSLKCRICKIINTMMGGLKMADS